jgi:hypothetical protein
VTNPKTIYRLQRKSDGTFNTDMTTGWIVKSIEMSFVKAQINDDTSERTFATFDDGSSPPWVYDATDTVTGRQLGVPAPTAAPTLVRQPRGAVSTDDRAAAVKAATDYFTTLATTPRCSCPTGSASTAPTQPTTARAQRTTAMSTATTSDVNDRPVPVQLRVFRLSAPAAQTTAASATPTTLRPVGLPVGYGPVARGLLPRPRRRALLLWPTWAGTNNDHWCVPFTAYAIAYTRRRGLRAALAGDGDAGRGHADTAFSDPDQLDEVMTPWAMPEREVDRRRAVPECLEGRSRHDARHARRRRAAQRAASIAAFYAQTDVSGEISNAKSNLAEALFGIAAREAFYTDFTGFEGGGP